MDHKEQGYDGVLVAKDNVDQLAAGLSALMGDAALRRHLGQAAKQRTADEFSGESYLKLFEELVVASVHASGARAPASIAVT